MRIVNRNQLSERISELVEAFNEMEAALKAAKEDLGDWCTYAAEYSEKHELAVDAHAKSVNALRLVDEALAKAESL